MPQLQPQLQPRLDRVFQALADPTRRAVVARLSAGPTSTSDLAKNFRMALPSFTQHLGVLERSGLVRSRKVGRVRTWELRPEPLRDASHWLERQRALWIQRLDQLDRYLVTLKAKEEEES